MSIILFGDTRLRCNNNSRLENTARTKYRLKYGKDYRTTIWNCNIGDYEFLFCLFHSIVESSIVSLGYITQRKDEKRDQMEKRNMVVIKFMFYCIIK